MCLLFAAEIPRIDFTLPRTIGMFQPYFEPAACSAHLTPIGSCSREVTDAARPCHISRLGDLDALLLAVQRKIWVGKGRLIIGSNRFFGLQYWCPGWSEYRGWAHVRPPLVYIPRVGDAYPLSVGLV